MSTPDHPSDNTLSDAEMDALFHGDDRILQDADAPIDVEVRNVSALRSIDAILAAQRTENRDLIRDALRSVYREHAPLLRSEDDGTRSWEEDSLIAEYHQALYDVGGFEEEWDLLPLEDADAEDRDDEDAEQDDRAA